MLSTGYFQEEKLSPLDFCAGPGAAVPGRAQCRGGQPSLKSLFTDALNIS